MLGSCQDAYELPHYKWKQDKNNRKLAPNYRQLSNFHGISLFTYRSYNSENSNLSFLGLLLFLIFFNAACSPSLKQPGQQSSEAILRASFFVEKYGQIIGNKQKEYIENLKARIQNPLHRIGKAGANFQVILLNSKQPMAFSTGGHIILISKGLVKVLNSEAQLAFVLAHEMSHVLLGHEKDTPENTSKERDYHTSELELEADAFAVVILISAGYDPREAVNALTRSYQAMDQRFAEHSGYPDLDARRSIIIEKIKETNWRPPGTVDRRDFQDFRKSL